METIIEDSQKIAILMIQNFDVKTALIMALLFGHYEVVKLLLTVPRTQE